MPMKNNKLSKRKLATKPRQSPVGYFKNQALQLVYVGNTKGKNTIASVVFGKYTAAGITKKEALVNGQCLRILTDKISKNYREKFVENQNKENTKNTTKPTPKLVNNLKNSRISSNKNGKTHNLQIKDQLLVKNLRSRNILQNTKRTRFPNPKFIDTGSFVKSRNNRVRKTMSTDAEMSEKEEPVIIPLKMDFEEVKSFLPLPAIDEPLTSIPVSSNKESDPLGFEEDPLDIEQQLPSNILVLNVNKKPEALANKSNGLSVPPLRTYPVKRAKKSPVPCDLNQKKAKLDESKSIDLEALLSEENKPKEENKIEETNGKTNEGKIQNNSAKSDDVEEVSTPKTNSYYNGNTVDNGYIYSLICRSGKPGRKRILKNNLGFDKLVHQLKLIKLPASHWKIRIFVTRDQQISEITFTNKKDNERCVKFSRSSITYGITFDSKVVTLIGAPTCIDSHTDISQLLDIVHTLDENDPVIEYGLSVK